MQTQCKNVSVVGFDFRNSAQMLVFFSRLYFVFSLSIAPIRLSHLFRKQVQIPLSLKQFYKTLLNLFHLSNSIRFVLVYTFTCVKRCLTWKMRRSCHFQFNWIDRANFVCTLFLLWGRRCVSHSNSIDFINSLYKY